MRFIALLFALFTPPRTPAALKPAMQYTLRVDSTDLSGWIVEIRIERCASLPV